MVYETLVRNDFKNAINESQEDRNPKVTEVEKRVLPRMRRPRDDILLHSILRNLSHEDVTIVREASKWRSFTQLCAPSKPALVEALCNVCILTRTTVTQHASANLKA